jgi:hypothetical protein
VDHRKKKTRSAFAIFTMTICDGLVPAWHDDRGYPVTYATERDAQIEIADTVMEHLSQFVDGQRDFNDAIYCEDFVLPVEVWPDGTVQTECGHRFGTPPFLN